jgi:plasmid stabilization system protein ParE
VSRVSVTIQRAARRELLDAVAWYDRESTIAGDRLLQGVNAGLQKIAENPEAYNFTFLGTRAYRLPSFPYLCTT